MARILLAEADASFRIALAAMLEADEHSVQLATSPLQLASAQVSLIDVAILDLAMVRPVETAVLLGGIPIVGIDAGDARVVPPGLNVVSKLFRPVDIEVARVFVTAALALIVLPGPSQELEGPAGVTLRPAASSAYVHSRPLRLSRRQFAILEFLLRHRGRAVSIEELARAVWSLEEVRSRNFVEAQLSRLRRKLRLAGAPNVIQTVRHVGYKILSPDEDG